MSEPYEVVFSDELAHGARVKVWRRGDAVCLSVAVDAGETEVFLSEQELKQALSIINNLRGE